MDPTWKLLSKKSPAEDGPPGKSWAYLIPELIKTYTDTAKRSPNELPNSSDAPAPALDGLSEEEPPVLASNTPPILPSSTRPSNGPSWEWATKLGDQTLDPAICNAIAQQAFETHIYSATSSDEEAHRRAVEAWRAVFKRTMQNKGTGEEEEEEEPLVLSRNTHPLLPPSNNRLLPQHLPFFSLRDEAETDAFVAEAIETLTESAIANVEEAHRRLVEAQRATCEPGKEEAEEEEEEAPLILAQGTPSDPVILPEMSLCPTLPEPWQRELSYNTSLMTDGTYPVVEYHFSDTQRQRIKQYFGSPVYLHYVPLPLDNAYHKFRVSLLYRFYSAHLFWFSTTSHELCDIGALNQAALIQELATEIAATHPKCKGSRFSIKFI